MSADDENTDTHARTQHCWTQSQGSLQGGYGVTLLTAQAAKSTCCCGFLHLVQSPSKANGGKT
eukprot:6483136-Amphidinium_carterae.1